MNINFHPETETYKFWTQQEDEQLKDLIENKGLGYKEASKVMNRSYSSCASRGRGVANLNCLYKSGKKYSVNENFWSTPNELNCYWAGMSAADASIDEKNNTFRIELSSLDKTHLQKFKEDTDFSGEIKDYERIKVVKSHGEKRILKTSKFSVTSIKWIEDLKNNFGIIPRKTNNIMPPNISDKFLLIKWLQGYTDGDGCIFYNKYTNKIGIKYISCNKQLIQWIKEYFDNFGNQLKLKPGKVATQNEKYYIYSTNGLKAAQFINYINSLNCYCLERKWKNPQILPIIDQYKQKYPQYFP